MLSLCQIAAVSIHLLYRDIVYVPLFIYCLFWCGQQGISVVGAPAWKDMGSSLGIPQGDVHKILIYHKQQIFSYRIEEAVSLKSLPFKIRPDIVLVYPTSNFLTNILKESSWMGAIWWPCCFQRGRAKLLCARLCACWLFWHPAFTKMHR